MACKQYNKLLCCTYCYLCMHSNFISSIVTSNKLGLFYKHVYTDHFISNVAGFSPRIAVFFRSFNTAIAVIYFRKLNPLLLMRTNHFL